MVQSLSQAIHVEVRCLGRFFGTQRTPLPSNGLVVEVNSNGGRGQIQELRKGGIVYNFWSLHLSGGLGVCPWFLLAQGAITFAWTDWKSRGGHNYNDKPKTNPFLSARLTELSRLSTFSISLLPCLHYSLLTETDVLCHSHLHAAAGYPVSPVLRVRTLVQAVRGSRCTADFIICTAKYPTYRATLLYIVLPRLYLLQSYFQRGGFF